MELGMNVETYQLHHKNKQYVIAASQKLIMNSAFLCVSARENAYPKSVVR